MIVAKASGPIAVQGLAVLMTVRTFCALKDIFSDLTCVRVFLLTTLRFLSDVPGQRTRTVAVEILLKHCNTTVVGESQSMRIIGCCSNGFRVELYWKVCTFVHSRALQSEVSKALARTRCPGSVPVRIPTCCEDRNNRLQFLLLRSFSDIGICSQRVPVIIPLLLFLT